MVRIEVCSNVPEEQKAVTRAIEQFMKEKGVTVYAVNENGLRGEIWLDPARHDVWTLQRVVQDP